MTIARRRLLQALTVAGGFGTDTRAQERKLGLDVLRAVSAAHGSNLSDERLRIIGPALERRLSELRALRSFDFDDSVEPAQGILV